MRILFLSRWFPFPPDNGSKLRIYNLLRGLAQCHEVTLLSFVDDTATDPNSSELRSLCSQVQTVIRKPYQPYSLRSLAGYFASVPRSVFDTYSPEMECKIGHALAASEYNLIIASQEGTASYGHCFRNLPALFEEVEIGVLYEQYAKAATLWPRFRHYLTWYKQKRYLARILRYFKACTVVSHVERSLLTRTITGTPHIEVIPNCVNFADYAAVNASPQSNRLIFTGSFRYPPNHEAMVWFLREVYPLLKKTVPSIHLLITGDHVNLSLPPADDVTLTGRIENVWPLIASSWLSLAPIHTGGGTRLKILEAMALGTPIVATSKGCEGLEVESGRHLLIADTPTDFSNAVLRILKEPSLRSSLAKNALELLRKKYEWSTVMPQFLNLAEHTAQRE